MSDPAQLTVDRWHQYLAGDLPGGLDALLAEDVVFVSPIVFTPQEGRELTKLYLQGAAASFGAADPAAAGAGSRSADSPTDEPAGAFGYRREVVAGHDAVLEFEATVDGIVINGVDMLTVDDDGLITEFKVMLRPLKAINLMHAKMRAALAQLESTST